MPTIARAVRSVCDIMSAGDELIVIDDASSDGTSEFLAGASIRRREVRVLRNEVRQGVAVSLNLGLKNSQHAFIGRIDADDVCLPWRRSLDLHQIRRGCDFGFSAAVLFGSGMRWPLPQYSPDIKVENLLRTLAVANPFVHSTMIARRDAIVDLGGYSPVPAEDYDLWIRAAEKGYRFTRSPIPKILYRVHAGQLTAAGDWVMESRKLPSRDSLIRKLGEEPQDLPISILGRIARVSKKR